jgi:hypothetical protein
MSAPIPSNSTNAGAPPQPWEKQPGSLASPPNGSRASIQSDRHRALARVYKTALRSGETSSHIFSTFSFTCVRAQSEPSGG